MSGSLDTAGVVLITVPAVELGGLSLLKFLAGRVPGYFDNPMRRSLSEPAMRTPVCSCY